MLVLWLADSCPEPCAGPGQIRVGRSNLQTARDQPQRRSAISLSLVSLLPCPAALAEEVVPQRGNRVCEATISHLAGAAGDVFLVGVAHVSNRSAELAREAVLQARPDLVMVELDSSRIDLTPTQIAEAQSSKAMDSFSAPQSAGKSRSLTVLEFGPAAQSKADNDATGATKASSESPWQSGLGALGGAARGLASDVLRLVLGLLYKLTEKYLDVSAGSEMLEAARAAVEVGAPVLLGDRPARKTLERLAEEAGKTDLQKLDDVLQAVMPEVSIEEASSSPTTLQALLESTRDQSTTRLLRQAFKEGAPGLFNALVDERDAYMADNLLAALRAGRRRVVSVVGSIHVQGIEERLVERAALRVVDTCIY